MAVRRRRRTTRLKKRKVKGRKRTKSSKRKLVKKVKLKENIKKVVRKKKKRRKKMFYTPYEMNEIYGGTDSTVTVIGAVANASNADAADADSLSTNKTETLDSLEETLRELTESVKEIETLRTTGTKMKSDKDKILKYITDVKSYINTLQKVLGNLTPNKVVKVNDNNPLLGFEKNEEELIETNDRLTKIMSSIAELKPQLDKEEIDELDDSIQEEMKNKLATLKKSIVNLETKVNIIIKVIDEVEYKTIQ